MISTRSYKPLLISTGNFDESKANEECILLECDVSAVHIASIISMEGISVLETTLAVTEILRSVFQLLVTANVVPSSLFST
jgi:hypothetical protein